MSQEFVCDNPTPHDFHAEHVYLEDGLGARHCEGAGSKTITTSTGLKITFDPITSTINAHLESGYFTGETPIGTVTTTKDGPVYKQTNLTVHHGPEVLRAIANGRALGNAFFIQAPDGTLTDATPISSDLSIQPEPDNSEPIITEFSASFEIEIPHSHKRADREARKALQRMFGPKTDRSATQPKPCPARCRNCNQPTKGFCRKCNGSYNIKTQGRTRK